MFQQVQYLNYVQLGFEFEFLCEYHAKQLKSLLKKDLHIDIHIPYSYKTLNDKDKSIEIHSSFTPTKDVWKLEKDHSADNLKDGKIQTAWELISGPIPYYDARIFLIKVLNFIKKHAYTTSKTGIHINLNIKLPNKLGVKHKIQQLDKLKFCLEFDEELIWKEFPERKNNVYAQSIKNIIPLNPFTAEESISNINPQNYKIPDTKYFGVNFIKQAKDYLEFRYLGGKDYEKKTDKILKLIEYFADVTYNSIIHPEYTKENITELNRLLKKQKKFAESFISYEKFKQNYPNIKILIDLKENEQIVKTYYLANIRKQIYTLLSECGMKKGLLNFDTDISRLQVKDSNLKNCKNLQYIDFLDCTLNGFFQDCLFYNCEIVSSHLEDCELTYNNRVQTTKIKESSINMTNTLNKCYIENSTKVISGKIENSIIRKGEPNRTAILINCVVLSKDGAEVKDKENNITTSFELPSHIFDKK